MLLTQLQPSKLYRAVLPALQATHLPNHNRIALRRSNNSSTAPRGMGKASTALSKRLHAFVSGRVQGVFFRNYTKAKALELGLTGWVRNRRDGRVEVTAEGYEEDLQALLKWLHSGSPEADVAGVDFSWGAATGEFNEFDQLWTE